MKTVELMVAELRKAKGVTQSELADYLGVSFQSVSKWENGTSMPDIALLPKLSEYFDVSVDEILGLKPLMNRAYNYRRTDKEQYWDKKLDYLKNSRMGLWNDDYMEFLIKKVWNITEPVKIIDFGCGYGYLGMVLLPFLPKGSTYTGIDIQEAFLDEAKLLFRESQYITEFIKHDLNSYTTEEKYDIAICQALLRHLSDPKAIIKKMADSVTVGGMVVCIEVNREMENAGLFINGVQYNAFRTAPALQKLWRTEFESEGRDYLIGMKTPFYMQECGLHHIDVRLNDKVTLINPHSDRDEYHRLLSSFIAANNWNRVLSDEEQEKVVALFMNRGAVRAEAENYVKSNLEMSHYLMNNDAPFIVKAMGLFISYGTK